jgi:micrococcal nuclease
MMATPRVGRWRRACAALSLALAVLPAWAERGVVTHVTDGDTVWVRVDGPSKPLKVRVLGIDAPERCQAGGQAAREALASRVLGRSVDLAPRTHDDYGRVLSPLLLGGEDIGAWMVLQGHAWSYRYRRSMGPYAAEEAQARERRRGVFSDPAAEEPRWFRRGHGPCDPPGRR